MHPEQGYVYVAVTSLLNDTHAHILRALAQEADPEAIGNLAISCAATLASIRRDAYSACHGVLDINTEWNKKNPTSAMAFSFLLDVYDALNNDDVNVQGFVSTGANGVWSSADNFQHIDIKLVVSKIELLVLCLYEGAADCHPVNTGQSRLPSQAGH